MDRHPHRYDRSKTERSVQGVNSATGANANTDPPSSPPITSRSQCYAWSGFPPQLQHAPPRESSQDQGFDSAGPPFVVGASGSFSASHHRGGELSRRAVSTSTPVSVTRMVCSNCALRLPSTVTEVQPSGHVVSFQLPRLIIGCTRSFTSQQRLWKITGLSLFDQAETQERCYVNPQGGGGF